MNRIIQVVLNPIQ